MFNTGIEYTAIKPLSEILNIDYDKTTVTERAKMRYDYIMSEIAKGSDDVFWDYLEYIPGVLGRNGSKIPPWRTEQTLINIYGEAGTNIKGNLWTYKGTVDARGYVKIVVRSPALSFSISAHRAAASTFIPMETLDQTLQVNHIDAIKTNNYFKNFEWVTHQENSQHAVSMGIDVGINNKNTKPILGTWIIPDEDYGTSFVLVGKTEIFAAGLNAPSIHQAADNPTIVRYGCIWKYVPKEDVPLVHNGVPETLTDKIKDLAYTNMNTEPVKATINVEGKHKGEEFCVYGASRLKELGFLGPHILNVVKGKLKTHGGCKWIKVSREEAMLLQRDPTPEQLKFLFPNK
ncbi:putative HNH endonuclease [Aeromonas phage CF8]|nr:putative HNH endonuclease [Aeromonas phage CF8]